MFIHHSKAIHSAFHAYKTILPVNNSLAEPLNYRIFHMAVAMLSSTKEETHKDPCSRAA